MVINYRVNHPMEKVLPYFSDLEKFGSIHPHINKVVKTEKGFHVAEQILFLGFIRNKNEYDVIVDTSDNTVTYSSQVKNNVSLQLLFTFSTTDTETVIQEEIKIESSGLIRMILTKVLIKAHIQLIKNLNALSIN